MINECGAVGRMRTSSLISYRIERRTQNHLEQKLGSGVEVGSNIDHMICCEDNGYNIAGAHASVTYAELDFSRRHRRPHKKKKKKNFHNLNLLCLIGASTF
jgi:hypothetical protein